MFFHKGKSGLFDNICTKKGGGAFFKIKQKLLLF